MKRVLKFTTIVMCLAAEAVFGTDTLKIERQAICAGASYHTTGKGMEVYGGIGTSGPKPFTTQRIYNPRQIASFRLENGKAVLKMPEGAVPFIVGITVHNALSDPVKINTVTLMYSLDKFKQDSGISRQLIENNVVEIIPYGHNSENWNEQLAAPATLRFSYSDTNEDGIVDGTTPSIRCDTLEIWSLDETHNLWVKVPGAVIDKESKTVEAGIMHFSVYGLFGAPADSLADAYAYPVPWRPNDLNPDNGTINGGITFTNLASECTIWIYTISGELIREIRHTDGSPTETWNGANSSGHPAASGVYIWRVKSRKDSKNGKVVVIR